MNNDNSQTIVLGPEYDEKLRAALKEVLRSMGARQASKLPWVPDLEMMVVEIGGQALKVEAETYMGLSISGPALLVNKVSEQVKARMS
jgi:hypothetical protein